ncbi:unnamed protein product [Coregonus sp. 'balchen']|nr:unnamed protein product [Coregonus sp. 'balchen']
MVLRAVMSALISLRVIEVMVEYRVNSYGGDDDQSSSSDGEDVIVRQFEISVSRSQSFRSMGTTEVVAQATLGKRCKFTRLLSDQ